MNTLLIAIFCYAGAAYLGVKGVLLLKTSRQQKKPYAFIFAALILAILPSILDVGNMTLWGDDLNAQRKNGTIVNGVALADTQGQANESRVLDAAMDSLHSPMQALPKSMQTMPASILEKSNQTSEGRSEKQFHQKFIAIKHLLRFESPHGQLQGVYTDTVKFCLKLGCEVLSSELSAGGNSQTPTGHLNARLLPDTTETFMNSLSENGIVKNHSITNEDKTNQVIDTEANIANMTALRDRLRKLVAEKSGNISDILEVERELTRVQTDIDKTTGIRLLLSKQTSMTEVYISFTEKAPPVIYIEKKKNGLTDLPEVFMSSIKMLHSFLILAITILVYIAPWLTLGFVLYGIYRLFLSKFPDFGKLCREKMIAKHLKSK